MRRVSILFLATLAVAVVAAVSACRSRPPDRPDVLLVTIDTLRADHCSAYGYPIPTTPVLTALASAGTLYRNAYSVSATTAPSHASLLTGTSFRTLGIFKNGQHMSEDAVTVAETLTKAGYATAAFVSSLPLRGRFGFAQGFDVYDDEFTAAGESIGRHSSPIPHDRVAAATLAKFEKWIQARRDSRPLFVWIHFVDPHFPYRAPEKFQANWPAGVIREIPRYDAEVHYADKQLGRAIERFDARAGGGTALVIVTSDHGEGLGDHGWMSHGVNLYEEAVRVPLVVRWRGHAPAGSVRQEPVSLIDVATTVVNAARVPVPSSFEGHDLLGPLDPDRVIFMQRRAYRGRELNGVFVAGEMTALMRAGDKYIVAPEESRRELYRLQSDPGELQNLLAKPQDAASADQSAVAAAARHDDELAVWKKSHPESGSPNAPVDREDVKALRALGYVD